MLNRLLTIVLNLCAATTIQCAAVSYPHLDCEVTGFSLVQRSAVVQQHDQDDINSNFPGKAARAKDLKGDNEATLSKLGGTSSLHQHHDSSKRPSTDALAKSLDASKTSTEHIHNGSSKRYAQEHVKNKANSDDVRTNGLQGLKETLKRRAAAMKSNKYDVPTVIVEAKEDKLDQSVHRKERSGSKMHKKKAHTLKVVEYHVSLNRRAGRPHHNEKVAEEDLVHGNSRSRPRPMTIGEDEAGDDSLDATTQNKAAWVFNGCWWHHCTARERTALYVPPIDPNRLQQTRGRVSVGDVVEDVDA